MTATVKLSANFGRDARSDADEKVSGRAVYTADIAIPGMLHAKVLRCPHAHARVKQIDISRAAALAGVHAILTRDTYPAHILSGNAAPLHGFLIKDQPIVAVDRCRYEGDIVAAVAADNEAIAVQALHAIKVEYEELPFVGTIDEALRPGSPQIAPGAPAGPQLRYGPGARSCYWPRPNVCFEFHYQCGDGDVFSTCDHVFEDEFGFSRMNHFHLEPFVSVAQATHDRIELWTSTQMPFPLRGQLSQLLKIPEHCISIRVPFVGGAFGAKSGIRTEAIAVLLSMMSARPVRLCYAMEEDFLTASQHAAVVRLKTGVMADGTLIARASEILLDAGAYADVSPLVAEKAAYRAPGPYRYKHLDSRCSCVMTNTTPAGAFRGFGGTQATWASESQIDMIARRLGIDPFDMRMKNLLQLGEAPVPGEGGVDSDLSEGLELVAREIGYRQNRAGTDRGVGLAIGFKDAATSGEPAHAQARVKITTRGDILLQSGAVEMGQGLMTALSQVTAEILGTSPQRVRYAPIDTDATPFDRGTIASVGVAINGKAVEHAAQAARSAVLDFAANRLGCSAEELTLENWSIRRRPWTRIHRRGRSQLSGRSGCAVSVPMRVLGDRLGRCRSRSRPGNRPLERDQACDQRRCRPRHQSPCVPRPGRRRRGNGLRASFVRTNALPGRPSHQRCRARLSGSIGGGSAAGIHRDHARARTRARPVRRQGPGRGRHAPNCKRDRQCGRGRRRRAHHVASHYGGKDFART
jgi:CO/xanthine dehydrogenase Mo-binding subunit